MNGGLRIPAAVVILSPVNTETTIRVLPNHVINKIAAGEVVERPAAVLKEIMENAIDAGATRLDAAIVAGGKKLIAVHDNGSGMTRDNALLSIERHATSKIRDVDDIERIHTLGFRGEALAAISAVSRFRLTTCRAGDVAGTEIRMHGGQIEDVTEFGRPTGTSVEVRDLFYNVPARRKFLRSDTTELTHLREAFLLQALSHPEIGMTLQVDQRDIYQLPAGTPLSERLRDLFGAEYGARLRPVHHQEGELTFTGFVSLPEMNRADRHEQFVFINGRAASAPVIQYAIREGYHTLLPADRFPSVFLYLAMDPELVDVNVHPAKKEVRFRQPGQVRDALINAIRGALSSSVHAPQPPPAMRPKSGPPRADAAVQMTIENLPLTRTFSYPRLPMETLPPPAPAPRAAAGTPAATDPAPAVAVTSAPWTSCRVLGQVGGLYVLLETEDGMVLMDPHAAHERVLFERFTTDIRQGHVAMQNLLLPQTVTLQPADALRLRKALELLRKMGFGIAEFGSDTFIVDALPSYFAELEARGLLLDITHQLEQAGARGAQGRWQEEAIAQAACKAACKAHDRLRLEEIEQLVIDLARAEMPYTCPHGRPTLILMSFRELNKKFGRE